MSNEAQCPFSGNARKHTIAGAPSNADWWPNQLKLGILHQHSSKSDPMGEAFDYAKAFRGLDLDAVVRDLRALMTDSQAWQMQCGHRKNDRHAAHAHLHHR